MVSITNKENEIRYEKIKNEEYQQKKEIISLFSKLKMSSILIHKIKREEPKLFSKVFDNFIKNLENADISIMSQKCKGKMLNSRPAIKCE